MAEKAYTLRVPLSRERSSAYTENTARRSQKLAPPFNPPVRPKGAAMTRKKDELA